MKDCLFIFILPLDFSSYAQELTGFCVLDMGSVLWAADNLSRTFLLQCSLPLVLVAEGRIINILKMFNPLAYVQPAKRKEEKLKRVKQKGCESNTLFSVFRSATDFS